MSGKRIFAIGFALLLLVMSFLVTRAQDGGCIPGLNMAAEGYRAYVGGNYADALLDYNCAIQTDPDNAAIYNARGNTYRELGNYAQAIVDYTRAIEINSSVAVFYNNRGFAEYKQGLLDAALTDFNRAIELEPNLAYAYNNRGLIYAQRGQNNLAAADFNKAIALGHYPIAWPTNNLANLHLDTSVGDVPSIEVVAAPSDPLAAGQAALRADDYDKALAIFTQQLELDPESFLYYCERAGVYYAMGDYQHAIEDYTKAISLNHMALHYTWRGNSYAHLGQNDKALADYADALRAAPNYSYAYLFRALLYHQTGETDLSRDDFAQWMKANGEKLVSQLTPGSGETLSLNITDNQFYTFKVPVKKGQVLTIETATTPDSGVDPMLILVESGIPQAFDDDGGMGVNAAIKQFVVPGDCVYDLYLIHPGSFGPLDLTITITTP